MRIGVLGALGRMGALMAQEILEAGTPVRLSSILVRKEKHHLVPPSVSEHTSVTSHVEEVFFNSDVVMDFTHVDALEQHTKAAVQTQKPFIVGMTGLAPHHHVVLEHASRTIPLLYAANLSLGMTLMEVITVKAARALPALFDIEILEMHHRYKKDAPSGSALMLGKAAAQGREISLEENICLNRPERQTQRSEGEIGFSVMRGGNVAGDHQVLFTSDEEMITFSHRALDRRAFSKGGLTAALWLVQQSCGMYTMKNVLGF